MEDLPKLFSTRTEFQKTLENLNIVWGPKKAFYWYLPEKWNGVLIIAPHAGKKKLQLSEEEYITLGEKNTDALTVVASANTGAGFIIVKVPRDEADFARPPELLGTGARAKLATSMGRARVITTHNNPVWQPVLEKFHKLITEIQPRFLLTYHGMSSRAFDVLLGFGKDRRYIGGWENAKKFRENIQEFLQKWDVEVKIGISKKKLTGESDYILNHYTAKFGIPGALVEYNWQGRKGEIPSREYQLTAVAIAKAAERWVKRL